MAVMKGQEPKYIPDFKAKLQATINRHLAEAARLTEWRDRLEAAGFNWDEMTETQAWAIWKYSPAMVEKEAQR